MVLSALLYQNAVELLIGVFPGQESCSCSFLFYRVVLCIMDSSCRDLDLIFGGVIFYIIAFF
jgi:hypothetical protein